jgi:MYXO-CTERM domain-containing protein
MTHSYPSAALPKQARTKQTKITVSHTNRSHTNRSHTNASHPNTKDHTMFITPTTDEDSVQTTAPIRTQKRKLVLGLLVAGLFLAACGSDDEATAPAAADDAPAARGERPLTWSLGKIVGDSTVGAPDGMRIDRDSGLITWTPAAAQRGPVSVVLVAENAAGSTAQEWEIVVDGEAVSVEEEPESCSCAASEGTGSSSSAGFALFVVLALCLRRRRQIQAVSIK